MHSNALKIEPRTKILVAEDDSRCAEIVEGILVRENFDVTFTQNGLEALLVFIQHDGHFSLVLSDFQMPEMNGYQLAKALLLIDRIPFILMTGGIVPYEFEQDLTALNVPILSKPFSSENLVGLVNDALE